VIEKQMSGFSTLNFPTRRNSNSVACDGRTMVHLARITLLASAKVFILLCCNVKNGLAGSKQSAPGA
jgi:hypothetical protein